MEISEASIGQNGGDGIWVLVITSKQIACLTKTTSIAYF